MSWPIEQRLSIFYGIKISLYDEPGDLKCQIWGIVCSLCKFGTAVARIYFDRIEFERIDFG